MRLLILLFLGIPLVFSLKAGEDVDWIDRPYLVKIAASTSGENHIGCTGVLITPTLVLTSSKCFKEEGKHEAIVITIRGNGTTSWKRQTKKVRTSEDYALLTLHHRKHDYVCPPETASPLVAHLPLSFDPHSLMWTPPSIDTLLDMKCRIVGFETVKAEHFAKNISLLEMGVTLERGSNMVSTHVDPGKGPCYDDYGIPLECQNDEGSWIIVGMIHGITREEFTQDEAPVEDSTQSTESFCSKITGIRFSLFNDKQIGHLLKKHFSEVLSIQQNCFLHDHEEEATPAPDSE